MSWTTTINGVIYTNPDVGENFWGTQVKSWMVAAGGTSAAQGGFLKKDGGLFQIISELDFGTAYGIKSLLYTSRSAASGSAATTGLLRLKRADQIGWRNQADAANLVLGVSTSNWIQYQGVDLADISSIQTLTNKTISGATNTITNIGLSSLIAPAAGTIYSDGSNILSEARLSLSRMKDGTANYVLIAAGAGSSPAYGLVADANIDAAAAIAYSKLALTDSIVDADINSAAAIAYSKLTLTGSIVNADVSSSAAIAYSKLNLTTSIVNTDIGSAAAIARTKIASGTAAHVVINDGSGVLSSEAQLAPLRGGTGLSTVGTANQILGTNAAANALEHKTLASGTSGTDFAIVHSAGGIAFNIPSSSLTNRGLLTATDWDTFNSKVGGSGTSGQVALFNGTGTITSNSSITYNAGANTNSIVLASSVKIGTNTTVAATAGHGAIRYNAGVLEYSDATNWITLAAASVGVQSLNALTANVQMFATGTTGNDFAIVSATDTHTFNLPDASATARGVLTTGTQTIAGDKYFSGRTVLGDPGTEATGININGFTFQSSLKVSDIDGTNFAQVIMHRHSTIMEPLIIGARSNSDTAAHIDVVAGQNLFSIYGAGWAGANYKLFGCQHFAASAIGSISNTSAPGKWFVEVTKNGEIIPTTALTIDADLSATFAGSIMSPTLVTPALGTPSALVGTNISGTGSNFTSGTSLAFQDTKRYGFMGTVETTIAFDGTDTFTLGGTTWSYYRAGIKYTISGNKTVKVAISMVDDTLYYIYIDSTTGALTSSTSAWTLLDTKVPVATVYWKSTQTPNYLMADERHSCLIDRRYHYEHHVTEGTQLASVGAISGQTINADVDAQKTFALGDTVLVDEDLVFPISGFTQPNGVTLSYYQINRTGASTRSWSTTNMPFVYNTGTNWIQWDNGGTLTDATGGGGGSTRWVNSYLCFSNITNGWSTFIIPGRAIFTSLASAQGEDPSLFTFTNFPTGEFVIAYQLTWTTITSASTGKCRLAATPRRIKVAAIQASASAPSIAHNSLAGLNGGTIDEYFHLTDAEYTGSGTGVFARVTSPTFVTSIITPAINAAGALTIGTNGTTQAISISTAQIPSLTSSGVTTAGGLYSTNLTIKDLTSSTTGTGPGIRFEGYSDGSTGGASTAGEIRAYKEISSNDSSFGMRFVTHRNGVGPRLALTLGSDLNATLAAGNLVIGTAGKGIDFDPAGSGGATKLLDDYEKTISLTITDQSGAGLTITNNGCTVIKVGDVVTINYYITYPSTANTSNAALNIPFTSVGYATGICRSSYANVIMASVSNSASVVNFFTTNNTQLTNANLSSNFIIFSITYLS